uniref:GST C-terminal domain-containing protein n=1 Tax=Steinernema glaseri TaxID=37863 RepID=A0A1I7Z526_9BILA
MHLDAIYMKKGSCAEANMLGRDQGSSHLRSGKTECDVNKVYEEADPSASFAPNIARIGEICAELGLTDSSTVRSPNMFRLKTLEMIKTLELPPYGNPWFYGPSMSPSDLTLLKSHQFQ